MKNIVKEIILELTKRGETISFAESCTGGRIASAFTAISGASLVLNGSCVTYSNQIKHQWLGVDEKVLNQYGAVSEECVSQMLDGIQKMAHSDYAIAVSGVAGPSGGTELKPVGTVYIGFLTPTNKKIFHCKFSGLREDIQEQSTEYSIKEFAKLLKIKSIS